MNSSLRLKPISMGINMVDFEEQFEDAKKPKQQQMSCMGWITAIVGSPAGIMLAIVILVIMTNTCAQVIHGCSLGKAELAVPAAGVAIPLVYDMIYGHQGKIGMYIRLCASLVICTGGYVAIQPFL